MGTNPKSKSDGGVPGLYLLAANDIFTLREQLGLRHVSVGVSLFEIYMEKAYDLLNNRKECPVRVDEKNVVHIVGLSEQEIGNVDQLMNIIDFGQNCRITGKTSANEHSSRSHAILQIVFRNNQTRKSCGKMSFIDLAGNERAADTNSSNKQTMSDGAGINQSLLALKECKLVLLRSGIRDLDSGKDLVRFRSSKLTMVLKDSFVGNTKTIMFANISPVQSSCEQTMNTLRYADRVKELKNPNRRRTDTSVDLADNLMLARNNGLSTNGSKKLSVTSKMPGGHSQGEPMTATALLNMHQTQYNQQMAGLPVESENFGFKPTQSRPNFPTDSHMKINKRVSTPVEVSKSSRTMGGQGYGVGNLTKPSGMMENGVPVLTNNTNQILGQNQHYSTEADWRRDHQSIQNTGFGPSHLQNQQYGAGNLKPSSQKSSLVGKVPGKPAGGASALLQNYLGEQMNGSQSTAIMEPENHHNGMSVEGFPAEASEESENRAPDFGTDPLRAAREKKFAQKRTQPPSKQVGSATGSEYDHLDLPALKRAHSDIIKQILQEEDIIISQHKDALDLKVSKVKHEMSLLSSFEKGGSRLFLTFRMCLSRVHREDEGSHRNTPPNRANHAEFDPSVRREGPQGADAQIEAPSPRKHGVNG